MKSFAPVALFLMAISSSALAHILPAADMLDGFYTHHIDENGVNQTQYHGTVPDGTLASNPVTMPLTKRALISSAKFLTKRRQEHDYDNGVSCWTDSLLNLDDMISAQSGFENWIGGGRTASGTNSYKSGTVVVYWCAYDTDTETSSSFASDMNLLTNDGCGNTTPGWVNHGGYGRGGSSSGRDQSSQPFC
ncbi:hypothetical protein B7463_g9267, partial [Scytalidium lignicola]